MKKRINKLKKLVGKYRRLLLLALILLFLSYLSGFLTGWWVVKGKLGSFPKVSASIRLLVLAPHPDDEVIMAGGLIQRVLAKGGQVRVIFLTSGDGSRVTVAFDSKKVDLSPSEFISLGETRIQEAFTATGILGLKKEDIYFLGFPDQGLTKLLQKNLAFPDANFVSPTTKVDHVPYSKAFRPGEAYLGENLISNVRDILTEYRPNLIVVGHPRDGHPDHRASYLVIEKLRQELPAETKVLGSLVHFRGYPNPGGYLFPPRKLFGGDWVSLELTSSEIDTNKSAIKAHLSQYEKPEDRFFFDRLVARNQIFEIE